MNIDKLFPRDIDKENFAKLKRKVQGSRCVAFLGAGVSRNNGYRTWKELVFSTTQKDKYMGLLELAGIPEESVQDKDLPSIIDLCRDAIGREKYHEFLKGEYLDKQNHVSDKHILTLRTNFRHFITTNFDPLLYSNASGFVSNMLTHPGNDLVIASTRTIYYIHGRAFLRDDEPPEKLEHYLDNLIFGEASFDREYRNGFEIKQFLYNTIKSFSLVFIGFSMEDAVFRKTLENLERAKSIFFENVETFNALNPSDTKNEYCFLEYPTLEEAVTLEDPRRNKEKFLIEKFSQNEMKLNENNIQVIGYYKMDASHSGLTSILETLQNQSRYSELRNPTETLQASISATYNLDEI